MKAAARQKPSRADYAWTRAGLEIKVCPVSGVDEHLVLFRRVDGPQFFLYKGSRHDANKIAGEIAIEISRAIDRELEASIEVGRRLALSPGGIRKTVSAFNEVVDALMGQPQKQARRPRGQRGAKC